MADRRLIRCRMPGGYPALVVLVGGVYIGPVVHVEAGHLLDGVEHREVSRG